MSDVTSILEAGGTFAVVGDADSITVSAVQTSVPSNSIENMTDVDLQNLENGSILIYKTSTSKWTASRLLDQQNMEAGEF